MRLSCEECHKEAEQEHSEEVLACTQHREVREALIRRERKDDIVHNCKYTEAIRQPARDPVSLE